MSGVFWTSEEDWGAGGIGWGDEAGERAVRVYKARCTNYSLFPKNRSLLLRCCMTAMHAGCMCPPATACAWFVTRPI